MAEKDELIYNYPENIKFKRTVTRTINDVSTTLNENHNMLIKNIRLSGKVSEAKFLVSGLTLSDTTSDISHVVNKLYNTNNNEVVLFHPDYYCVIPIVHHCTIDIIRNNDEAIILSYDEYEYEGIINTDIYLPSLYIKCKWFCMRNPGNELSVRLTMPHYIILDHDINDIEWMGIQIIINGRIKLSDNHSKTIPSGIANKHLYLQFFHYEISEGKIIIPISKNRHLYTKMFSFVFYVVTKKQQRK